MSTISVERNHGLNEKEALERVKVIVAEFANKLKADVSWSGNRATFKGKGFKGDAQVTANNVSIDVDLGLLLRPMKGRIESRLEEELRSKFA